MSTEKLSALLDGECSAEELDRLLDEMDRSPGLKRAYSRLCMTREAQEGTQIAKGQACICEGVMARLADEPAPAAVNPRITDLDSRRRWVPSKPLAAWAAAASVAAVAVLVAMPGFKSEQGAGASPGFVPEVSAPQFNPVSVPLTSRTRGLRTASFTPEEAEQMDELNSLMMEHSNSLAEQGMSGTLRYARVAAHSNPARFIKEPVRDAAYRPEDRSGDQR